MIECRRITKSFAGVKALDDVTCTFPRGQISALIGPSGAGKTLLFRHMLGLLRPDSGQVLIDRRNIFKLSEPQLQELRQHIGVLFQGPLALFSWLSVYENVAFQFKHLQGMREPAVRAEVMPLLEEVGLAADAAKLPEQLSVGMRSRGGFARAVALKPSILLLDSPDEGLDDVRLAMLREVIRKHHRAHATTTVVITHDLQTIFGIAFAHFDKQIDQRDLHQRRLLIL